jgi:hypothetical protein
MLINCSVNKKACIRSRTGDLLLTRQVLYQLSYTGLLKTWLIVFPYFAAHTIK